MANLVLTEEEATYISKLPFFDTDYVNYLKQFRYQPSKHIKINFDSKTQDLELEITGLWHETILYEVPLLSLISESYFRFVDKDWNYDNQKELAYNKAKRLIEAGCLFSEFGTRRRRDFKTQDMVLKALTEENEENKKKKNVSSSSNIGTGSLSGTSNVYLAMKYNITCIGTVGK